MRRVIINALGGPEQLEVQRISEDLRPGPGQILVDVEAAGINYLDVAQRKGLIHAIKPPFTPGLEGVGRVREIGDGARMASDALKVGQRVAWINVIGSYADQMLVLASQVVSIPETFTTNQGLLFQAITAQYLVSEYRTVRPGNRVLVHAAAGGVGGLLVQWLKHMGVWVVGTTSSDTKAAAVRALGADAVVNYGSTYDFLDEVLSLTDGRGVDLAFDSVGAASFANSLKALARGGTVVVSGSSSGLPPAVNPMELIDRCTRVAGGSLFSYVAESAELRRRAAAVIDGIEAGWLRMGDGTAFALDHASDAHRAIEGRGTQGKLYLRP